MLIAKIYVNERMIEEINILNMREKIKSASGDMCHVYKILKPEGFDRMQIWHNRDDGYEKLLKDVLQIIWNKRTGI